MKFRVNLQIILRTLLTPYARTYSLIPLAMYITCSTTMAFPHCENIIYFKMPADGIVNCFICGVIACRTFSQLDTLRHMDADHFNSWHRRLIGKKSFLSQCLHVWNRTRYSKRLNNYNIDKKNPAKVNERLQIICHYIHCADDFLK